MNFVTQPWKHQEKIVEMARTVPNLALFWEPGTGKTKGMIDILRLHCATTKCLRRTLVLCPVVVVNNWSREFGVHSRINEYDVVMLKGSGKRRAHRFSEAALDKKTMTLTRPRVFITNYEAMEMSELVELIQEWNPEILVCDESHRLKNPSSVRAKTVVRIADAAKHRFILTGTPLLNGALDIFNQFRILDAGQTFSLSDPSIPGGRRPMNFWEFRNIWFEDRNAGMPSDRHFPDWQPRAETYAQFHDMIYRKAMRVVKSECLDLPPLVRQRIDVELSPEQRRLYDEMKREFITWIKTQEKSGEPRAVVAQMALTKTLRLMQIISGYVKTEDGQEIDIKQNPRLEALTDMLQELTPAHKVIVWSNFHANYRQIAAVCKKLKIKYVEIHGGISAKDKYENVERFTRDEGVRVVIGNQMAGGIGINLVEASYSIFYSRNYSLEQDLQAEARNYRGGSEIHTKVTRIDIAAPGTVDDLILEALQKKQDIAEQVLGWKDKL